MDWEKTISLIEGLIERNLKEIELVILKAAWEEEKYEQIAQSFKSDNYTPDRLKKTGQYFWELLSSKLKQKINKNNFRQIWEIQAKNSIKPYSSPLPLNSSLYIEREGIELKCYQSILAPGGLLKIEAPKNMGKTSLIIRILSYAERLNYRTVFIDLHIVDREKLSDLKQLLRCFCALVSQELKLANKIDEYWDDIYGSKMSCNIYFEDYLLTQIDEPIVLVIDKLDYLLSSPNVAQDFFALLRAWYVKAKNKKLWQKLRIVLAYSFIDSNYQKNDSSPFNVGTVVSLPKFKEEEIKQLADCYQVKLNQQLIEKLKQCNDLNMLHNTLYQMSLSS